MDVGGWVLNRQASGSDIVAEVRGVAKGGQGGATAPPIAKKTIH